jgi:predicted RNase H-like HicB family nuclease/predicted RNA-binding Zn-ribbon protein involved in translation (DUF1610 family)
MSVRYLVKIHCYHGDYSARVPDLPGCVAAADSIEEVKDLIAEAIGMHLEFMRESGERIPAPRQSIRFAIDESSAEELLTWVEVKAPAPSSPRRKMRDESAKLDVDTPLPCPECGVEALVRFQGDCTLLDGTLIRNLARFHCESCGADVFDRAAMREIRRQRGTKIGT